MHLKISSAKWRPLCPGGDELRRLSAYRMKAGRWGLGGDVIQ